MQKYLITDPSFYTQNPSSFAHHLHNALSKHQPQYALYRDKQNPNSSLLASVFVRVCREFPLVRSMIHSDIDLAVLLGADGVHLTYKDQAKIKEATKHNLKVIVSTHTHQEVFDLEYSGADGVTYSPIFSTPNKGKPKGVRDLQLLCEQSSLRIFALGGIVTAMHLQELEAIDAYGFASIRYFYTQA